MAKKTTFQPKAIPTNIPGKNTEGKVSGQVPRFKNPPPPPPIKKND